VAWREITIVIMWRGERREITIVIMWRGERREITIVIAIIYNYVLKEGRHESGTKTS
jgi:hypothetical protein